MKITKKNKKIVLIVLGLIIALAFFMNKQTYSVVGDAQSCGVYGQPDIEILDILPGDLISIDAIAGGNCDGGHAIIDIFSDWNPYKEYSDTVSDLTCSAETNCQAQIYCCATPEPSSTAQCVLWYGASLMKTASCVPWINNGYKCTANGVTEESIPYFEDSFNYCSHILDLTCYYYPGSGDECEEIVYTQGGSCDDYGSYESHELYSDIEECINSIPENPYECTNGDSAPCTTGGCAGTKTCSSGEWGACIKTVPTCGGETGTCSDGIKNQDETGIDCGGICSACSGVNGWFSKIKDWFAGLDMIKKVLMGVGVLLIGYLIYSEVSGRRKHGKR